jgi:spore germination cell wall hydrolase CwlJ-like protein
MTPSASAAPAALGIFPHDHNDLDILTRTIWGEARGEGPVGWAAVAWVVRNRAAHRPAAWWGSTVSGVCLKPRQFSCWNTDDPNAAKLKALATDDARYQQILGVAAQVMNGSLADPTRGADCYQVIGTNAWWSKGRTPVEVIGHHEFYVLGPEG